MENNYIQPTDVADRLYVRKRHWFHGRPKITLTGVAGEFGTLKFDFGDEIVEFTIYVKDRRAILNAAAEAIERFWSFNYGIGLFEDGQ